MAGPSPDTRPAPWREGAEATVETGDFLGIPVVVKTRPVKAYRPRELDERLRAERLRTEVRLLRGARKAGVRTPVVLDVDTREAALVLERLDGPSLTEILEGRDLALRSRAVRAWGRALGRLHAAGISHGDLTASNVLWTGGDVALLDLSLGSRNPGPEELGIDLHLVEEDLNTLCPDAADLLAQFLEEYSRANPRGEAASRERAQEIKGRVRYA